MGMLSYFTLDALALDPLVALLLALLGPALALVVLILWSAERPRVAPLARFDRRGDRR